MKDHLDYKLKYESDEMECLRKENNRLRRALCMRGYDADGVVTHDDMYNNVEKDNEDLRTRNSLLERVREEAEKRCRDAVPEWASELREALAAAKEIAK